VYLFPLLIIAVSYNLVSAEREQGTLALLLSEPVALTTIVGGKIAVRAALVVLTTITVAVLAALVAGLDIGSASTLARLLMWTAVVSTYGALWFGIVILMTSFGRGSATNALALAAVWIVVVVVVPSALQMVVAVVYPMPSRVEMLAAFRVASDQAAAQGNRLLAKYYGDHPELVAVSDVERVANDVAVTRLAIDDETERQVRPVVDRYDIQLARQQGLVNRFRLLSPAIVVQDALNDVAGTGVERYRHFLGLVEEYHRRWRSFFAPMIGRKQRLTAQMYDSLDLQRTPSSTDCIKRSVATTRRRRLLQLTWCCQRVASGGRYLASVVPGRPRLPLPPPRQVRRGDPLGAPCPPCT
jgi:ABC-2 type transport system permease protein